MVEVSWDPVQCRRYTENMRRVAKFDHAPWAKAIAERIGPDRRALRIADIATGPGFMLLELGRSFPSADLIALDGASPMLNIAREEAAAVGQTIEAICCPATKLMLGDASVDVVCAKQLLNVTDGQPEIVQEMARVLRPGGLAFIIDFDRDCSPALRWLMGSLVAPAVGGFDTGRSFRAALRRALPFTDVDQWMRAAGLEVLPRVRRGVSSMAMGRKVATGDSSHACPRARPLR